MVARSRDRNRSLSRPRRIDRRLFARGFWNFSRPNKPSVPTHLAAATVDEQIDLPDRWIIDVQIAYGQYQITDGSRRNGALKYS